jgi:hypothetical protein
MDVAPDTTDGPPASAARPTGGGAPGADAAGHAPRVEVVAGPGVREFVAARGGRLYVWAVEHRCCTGGLTLLEADVSPAPGRQPPGTVLPVEGFELRLDAARRGLPRRLVLELGSRGRRVRAYWNDCAFVID